MALAAKGTFVPFGFTAYGHLYGSQWNPPPIKHATTANREDERRVIEQVVLQLFA